MRISDWSSDVCSSDLAVRDAVAPDVVDQSLLHVGIVVAVVQRRAAGEKVDVAAAVGGDQLGALGAFEHDRDAAAVAADCGLAAVDGFEGCGAGVSLTVRSEESRVGKGGVSTGRTRVLTNLEKKNVVTSNITDNKHLRK